MKRCAALFVVVTVAMLIGSACPERKEAIDAVGGAPKDQLDNAKTRIHADEQKLQKNADAASAVKE